MTRTSAGKRTTDSDGRRRVRGKASNGEGSLYRDSDGSWRATYTVPGVARPRRVRGRTREEAIARRAVKLAALGQPQSSTLAPDTTVGELAGWWLDVVARHRVRPSSLGKYRDRVNRIIQTLGSTPVRKVTRERVATWQSDLLNSGLAPKTVADVRVTLRQLLEQAVINELIASNPVDRVAAPKVVRSTKRALDSHEARQLVHAASTDRLGAAVALLFVHGWRVSEVLGLGWEDIDFDNAVEGDPRDLDREGALAALHSGLERTLDEDVAYGFRMLVDMGERSLSESAFLDPTTAVQCIDRLHDGLRQLANRRLPDGGLHDAEGLPARDSSSDELGRLRPPRL